MPIDLRCPGCQKLIRVPNDSVGRQAKCPACGMITVVTSPTEPSDQGQAGSTGQSPADSMGQNPTQGPNTGSPGSFEGQPQRFAGEGVGGDPGPADPANPYGNAPQSNPYAPASGLPNAMAPEGQIAPGTIDVSQALSDSWRSFQKNAGLMIGGVVLVMLFSGAVSMTVQGVMALGSEISGDNPFVMVSLWGLTQFGNQLVTAFINIGTILLFLAIVRGKQAGIHLLFGGMPFLVRGFVTSLLFGLIIGVGLILLIVPGIYLALRLWPFLYFIVDRDAGIVESLSLSWEYTSGNEVNGILLFLMGTVLFILGLALCVIGLFVTMPIAYALIAISYLMMTSQPYQRYFA